MCKTCKGKCLLNIEEEPFEAYSEIDETNEPFDAYSEFDNETDYLQEIEDGYPFFEFDEEGAPFDTETIDSEWLAEVNRNSKEYIRWVQRSLNQIMGLRLAEDGIMGAQTRSAIRSFQQKQGLVVDGNVGPNTEAALVKATGGRVPEPGMTMPTDTIKPAAARLKHFDKNSAKLKDFHAPEIDRVADRVAASWRTGQPIFTIYVKGHTSSEGPAQYNIGLGNHRALAVRKALQRALERKQKNLSYKVLILAQSKGAKEPIATNESEEGRSQNRRVEVFLSTKALAPLPKKPAKTKPSVPPLPTKPPLIDIDPGITTPKLPVDEPLCNKDELKRRLQDCRNVYIRCGAKTGLDAIAGKLVRTAIKLPSCLAALRSGNPYKILKCAFDLGVIDIDTFINTKNAIDKCAIELRLCKDVAKIKTHCL